MELAKRKPNRLKDYDYSQGGAYFITMCTKGMREVLWENARGVPGYSEQPQQLSQYGLAIKNEVKGIGAVYGNCIVVDKYVIMPNHIHLIILLQGDGGRRQVAPTISRIIQQFKGAVTKQIGSSLWQRSFHDHIIRNEREYQKIWQYIDENPLKWKEDCYYPKR